MNMKKLTAITLAIIMMISLLPISALAASFTDMPENHWASEAVSWCSDKGYVLGADSQFRPDDFITRADVAVVLQRILSEPKTTTMPFTDVAQGEYYYDSVAALAAAGIIAGTSETTFHPKNDITREAVAVLLARAFEKKAENNNSYASFSDSASISVWAREAISALVEDGTFQGYPDNTIRPGNFITRAEFCKIAHRILTDEQEPEDPVNETTITVSKSPETTTDSKVTITVIATDDDGIKYIGWRPTGASDTYESNSGFTDITSSGKFTVSSNGFYAVCAVDSLGNFSFKIIEVTNIKTSSSGSSGSGGTTTNYNVTFNTGGGSAVPTQTVAANRTATRPTDPTLAKAYFINWYSDVAMTNVFNFSTQITSNITLYAKWDYDNYALSTTYANATLNTAVPYETNITLKGGATSYAHADAMIKFALTAPTGADFDDFTLEYYDGAAFVPVTINSTTGIGYYGGTGLSIGKTYDVTTRIRATAAIEGSWRVTASVVSKTNDSKIYSAANLVYNFPVEDINNYLLSTDYQGEDLDQGVAFLTTVSLAGQIDSTPQTDAVVKLAVVAPTGKDISDLEIAYFNGIDYENIPVDALSGIGYFGTSGFAVNSAYNATTPIKVTATAGGDWRVTVSLISKNDNAKIYSDADLVFDFTVPIIPVTFVDGATTLSTQQLDYGDLATAPADPLKSGQIFEGWYTDDTFATAFDFTTPINAPTTVYAKFTAYVDGTDFGRSPNGNGYTVGFQLNMAALAYEDITSMTVKIYDGNTQISEVTSSLAKNQIATYKAADNSDGLDGKLTITTRTASFLAANGVPQVGGVYENNYLTNKVPCPEEYGNNGAASAKQATAAVLEITLIDGTVFIVNYDLAQGGLASTLNVTFVDGAAILSTQQVAYGALATKPADPVKTGCIFDSWYTDDTYTTEFDFTAPIITATTIHAKFITYVDGTDFGRAPNGNGYTVGFQLNMAALAYEDITSMTVKLFDGNTQISEVTSSLAKNQIASYKAADNSDGLDGRLTITTRTASFLAANSVPQVGGVYENNYLTNTTPCPEEYGNNGAASAKQATAAVLEIALDDGTVFTVNYDFVQGGPVSTLDATFVDGATTLLTQQIAYGALATKPADPVKDGSIFDGWYTDDSYTTEFDFTAPIITATTVFAKFTTFVNGTDFGRSPNGNGYTVGFQLNMAALAYEDISSMTVKIYDGNAQISEVTSSLAKNQIATYKAADNSDGLDGRLTITTRTASFLVANSVPQVGGVYENNYLTNTTPCPEEYGDNGAASAEQATAAVLEIVLTDGTSVTVNYAF